MTIDTSQTLEIEASSGKMLLLAIGSIAFVVASLWFILNGVNTGDVSLLLIGGAGAAFFGLCGGLILYRMMKMRGTIVTLSPEGLRDIRISPEIIPWSAFVSVSTYTYERQRFMILKLHPGEEEKLNIGGLAALTRKGNAAMGADGLALGTADLKMGYDALLETTIAYLRRYNS